MKTFNDFLNEDYKQADLKVVLLPNREFRIRFDNTNDKKEFEKILDLGGILKNNKIDGYAIEGTDFRIVRSKDSLTLFINK